MEIGKIGVFVGLAASIAAIVLYIVSLRGSRQALLAARIAFALTAASGLFCFFRLMWLVSHHQFQYQYVYEYSSADLVAPWKYAATWAGQEGSFLLWTFWTCVIGGLVAWKAGKWESRVMPIYISVLTFLFAILIWLSPYEIMHRGVGILQNYPKEFPWPPADGRGLNPSLQNYWMAIHPPVIFFGFSSLAVPFAYAIAAMLWREYEVWAPRVMPWVLMTTATLGVGLFMGGYWAYETLGWHGFWAWDPVENASLFPWLGGLGLLHGLVVQKSRGGMGRTNLFLAIVSWLLFLYGTFLTRSGVLSNFSVHSFVSLGASALMLLIVMIGVYGIGGFGLLAWRWRAIPGRPISDKLLSRDLAMVAAVTLMIVGAIVIGIGTSWPLLSRWTLIKHIPGLAPYYAAKGMAVQPIFYNKIGSALIIPALIVMGAVPFLAWGKTNAEKFLWKLLVPWFIALGFGFIVLIFVLHEASSGYRPSTETSPAGFGFNPDTPRMLVVAIATLGIFAAFANIGLALKVLRTKAKVTMGGWLAHVGIGLLLCGTIISNVYEKTDYVALVEGAPPAKTPFGYSIAFEGWTHDDQALNEEQLIKEWLKFDHAMKLRVTRIEGGSGVAHADDLSEASSTESKAGGKSFVALAPVFINRQKGAGDEGPQTMRWPYIHKELLRDFYVVAASDPKISFPTVTLEPGQVGRLGYVYENENSVQPVYNTNYSVLYKQFYMHGNPGQPGTTMGAEMDLMTPDGRTIPIKPGLKLGGANGPEQANVDIPELTGAAVMLHRGIDPATKRATVAFNLPDYPQRWVVPLAVTNKPGVNLVWLGVIVMGIGTLCAMIRRSLEARKGALFQTPVAAGVGEVPIEVPVAPVETKVKARVKRR